MVGFTGEFSELKAINDTMELLSKLESAVFFGDQQAASSDDDARLSGIPEGRVYMAMADAKAQLEDIPEVGDFVEFMKYDGPERGIVVDVKLGDLDFVPGDQAVHVVSAGAITLGAPTIDIAETGFSVKYPKPVEGWENVSVWIQLVTGITTLVLGSPVRVLSRYRDRQP